MRLDPDVVLARARRVAGKLAASVRHGQDLVPIQQWPDPELQARFSIDAARFWKQETGPLDPPLQEDPECREQVASTLARVLLDRASECESGGAGRLGVGRVRLGRLFVDTADALLAGSEPVPRRSGWFPAPPVERRSLQAR